MSVIENAHIKTVRNIAWSPTNHQLLASASFDGTACIWLKEQDEFECVSQLEGHENEVKSVAWSFEGKYLATCSRDKTVWIWECDEDDLSEYECSGVLSGHSQDVKCVKWHPSRNCLYSCSYDDSIKCWIYDMSVDEWICKYTITGHQSTVWALDFDRTGEHLMTCSDDTSWGVWNITETAYKCMGIIQGSHTRSIYSCSWSKSNDENNDSEYLATGAADNKIAVF